MRYEFENSSGERVELDMPMSEAPPFGEVRTIDGVEFRRVPSHATFGDSRKGSIAFPRFESHQLPRYWKHHKGAFSPAGKPRFSNRGEVDEAMARAGHDGTEMKYGEL